MDPYHVVPDQLPDENIDIERIFPKCPPKQRKQTHRTHKVHQHSRRELEARRNKTISSFRRYSNNNNNNNNNNNSNNNGDSSGSSDDQSNYHQGSKKIVSSGGQYSTNNQQQKSISTSSGNVRKSSKYMASQSLLQQLQRSQSSYNNTNLASSSPSTNNSFRKNLNQADTKQLTTNKVSNESVQDVRDKSGIVKSASSFAFVSESNLALSPKFRDPQQQQQLNSGSSKQPDDVVRAKGDNGSQSDLFTSNEIPTANSESRSSILRNTSKKDALTSQLEPIDNTFSNQVVPNSMGLTSNTPADPITRRALSNDKPIECANNNKILDNKPVRGDDDERSESSVLQQHFAPVVPMNSVTVDASPLHRAQPNGAVVAPSSQSADQGLREKVVSDITNPNSKELSTNNSIGPSQLATDGSDKSSIAIDESTRKEDDNCINLFVYDSASHHLQRTQIPLASGNKQQQQQQQQQQQPQRYFNSKNTRYRGRGKKVVSNNSVESSKTTNDDSFDSSSKDNNEITAEATNDREIISQPSEANVREAASSKQPLNIYQTIEPEPNPITSIQKSRQQEPEAPTHNIISTHHHQASQQLLTTDANDNEDDSVVRNDASAEELCSVEDDTVDERHNILISEKTHQNQTEITFNKPSDADKSICFNNNNNNNHNKASISKSQPLIGTLQTVDEKAEINIETDLDIETEIRESYDKTKLQNCATDSMSANQSSLARKGFVPPGYPQRIRHQNDTIVDTQSLVGGLMSSHKDAKLNSILIEKPSIIDGNTEGSEAATRGVKLENQRVKFDDDNLVSVRNENVRGSNIFPSKPALVSDKHHGTSSTNASSSSSSSSRRTSDHLSQMPSISEAQFESELDTFAKVSESADRDLSVGLNKVSLASSYNQADVRCDNGVVYRNDATLPSNSFQTPQKTANFYQQLDNNESQTNGGPQSQDLVESKSSMLPPETGSLSLRHHKLPNETSHYSLVRAGDALVNNSSSEFIYPSRSSSLQFNTLSDGDSGPEDSTSSDARHSSSRNHIITKRPEPGGLINIGQQLASSNRSNNSSFTNKNDDDMTPTTKTALIFPRLDEGLSSEAESCDDEVEDDDERAVDADVDADDDEYDDVIDDDVENDSISLDRGVPTVQIGQPSVDSYMRQPQPKPPQLRSLGSLQQHGSSLVGLSPDQPELHQVKPPNSSYGSYISQDTPLDHNDLKSNSSHLNQNGQSNYWLGTPSQQPNLPSSQPSSSNQQFNQKNQNSNSMSKNNREEAKAINRLSSDTDNETDRLLGSQRNDQLKLSNNEVISNNNPADLQLNSNVMKQSASSREVLIEGVLFNVKYLGSTHSEFEGRSEKEDRIHQAEMAVHEVKFRDGESQASTEVQLFISTEKIMVLDDKHRKIMMDHSLRTISYIADIGDAIVLIVRKKNNNNDVANEMGRPISKTSCHVFESSESHTITKSISQAFQVAYTELLKANGTGDTSSYLPKELDYQEVLNSQEMSTDELEMFARKENQREVIVPKEKGEILGLSIVESGWGSVLPTVVIANLKHDGPAYRCKRLSIGDQILSVNGISLVGLPLAECQEILRKTKKQRVARLSVVPCPITVEVKIKRPDTKYQLGFSVQNGVICSLLRGGIAERGGVRVGHRIMSINGTTVVGVPHEKIVTLLASSVGEIRMKTCLTSLYRLILGEENPVHF